MKVKVESEKVGLKLNIQKMKIMASGTITLEIRSSTDECGGNVNIQSIAFSKKTRVQKHLIKKF